MLTFVFIGLQITSIYQYEFISWCAYYTTASNPCQYAIKNETLLLENVTHCMADSSNKVDYHEVKRVVIVNELEKRSRICGVFCARQGGGANEAGAYG